MDNIICDCAFPALTKATKCCEDCEANPNYGQEENESMDSDYLACCDCELPALWGNSKCCENCLNNYAEKTGSNSIVTEYIRARKKKEESKSMDLFDTADLMLSLNSENRFIAEYVQLKIRYDEFCKMLVTYEANRAKSGDQPLSYLFKRQASAMEEYLHCLRLRALLEDIKLPEV